ncbi:hypothetical protein [Zavarzinella formosa]|uniref:hypothetical protein n=1 Tax=Zavarzinella formosa TaxID=360055 RepID=UPI0003173BC7|nr:hypothetical protein [Zavarzinella formosa]
MNVSTLQQFLRSLAVALQTTDTGLRTARDIDGAIRGLEPFRGLDLETFAAFLAKCDDFQRTGAVPTTAKIDLGALESSLQQITQLRTGAGDRATAKAELVGAQNALKAELTNLAMTAGLKGAFKPDPKWIDQQLSTIAVKAHAASLRELAVRIVGPEAFEAEDIKAEKQRLEKAITAAEWKLLAAEFSLPASTKGAKGIEEVLFKLTGHRPVKTKAPKKAPATPDAAKVTPHANRLAVLLERAKTEVQIPEAEIAAELKLLEDLTPPELVAVATQAGIVKPGKSKKEVLGRIEDKLSAGKRVMDQTEQ